MLSISKLSLGLSGLGSSTGGGGPLRGVDLQWSTSLSSPALSANTPVIANDLAWAFNLDTPALTYTPAAVTVENQTAAFGAKTLSGAGAYQVVDTAGDPVADLTDAGTGTATGYTYSAGVITPSSDGALAAQDGNTIILSDGTVVTLDITADTYTALDTTEGNAAFADASCTYGDVILLRDGVSNPDMDRVYFRRASEPAGTWGGDNTSSGNHVVIRPENPGGHIIGGIEINRIGATTIRAGLRLDGFTFRAPLTATSAGVREVAGGLAAILPVRNVSDVLLTNCILEHEREVVATDFNTYVGILNECDGLRLENVEIRGALTAVKGSNLPNFTSKNLVMDRIQGDCCILTNCPNMDHENVQATNKLFRHYPAADILAITRGATTTITVADATVAVNNEPVVFKNLSGAIGALLNDRRYEIDSHDDGTGEIVVDVDTTGVADWDGVAGQVLISTGAHSDIFQLVPAIDAGGQDNIRISGLRPTLHPDNLFGAGQVYFEGTASGGSPPARDGLTLESIFAVANGLRGISLAGRANATLRNCTAMRLLGSTNQINGSQIITDANCSNVKVYDCIANAFTFASGTVVEQIGNQTIALVDPTARPANATDLATYGAAFDSPAEAGDTYDVEVAYDTKSDGTFAGTILPGASSDHYNWTTGVYTNPRLPAFGGSDWSLTPGDTEIYVTIAAAPSGTDDIEYRVDGGTWTSSGGAVSFTVTGLTNATEYDIEIRAVDVNGDEGPGSSVKSETPEAASEAAFSQDAAVSWMSPADNADAPTQFTLVYDIVPTDDATDHNLDGLEATRLPLTIQAAGNLRCVSVRGAAGAQALANDLTGVSVTFGVRTRIVIAVDMAAGTFNLWKDTTGSATVATTFTGGTALETNRAFQFMWGANKFRGNVFELAVYKGALSTDGEVSGLGTPYWQVVGDGSSPFYVESGTGFTADGTWLLSGTPGAPA